MKVLSFLLMVGFLAMGSISAKAQSAAKDFKNVDVPTFKKMMGEKDVVILDVRTPREYAQGKIEGAVNMPLNTITSKASSLDKGKKYLVYCRSGARSRRASILLSRRGFEVYNLAHGYLSYMRSR